MASSAMRRWRKRAGCLRIQPEFTRIQSGMAQLVLASASPRRAELLRNAGLEFAVQPAEIDESRMPGELAAEYARRLATEKARNVAATSGADFVLGADTIVSVDERLLGKPTDPGDAARMLKLLSGRGHLVTTGVCLIGPKEDIRHETTEVFFRPDRK